MNMKFVEYILTRFDYSPDTTIGNLFRIGNNAKYVGYSLEDAVRADGVKVYGMTAIPCGRYQIVMEYSGRAGKEVPTIKDVPGFKYIRLHAVNDHTDTEGCIGFAKNRYAWKIQESVTRELCEEIEKEIKNSKLVFINIINIPNMPVNSY